MGRRRAGPAHRLRPRLAAAGGRAGRAGVAPQPAPGPPAGLDGARQAPAGRSPAGLRRRPTARDAGRRPAGRRRRPGRLGRLGRGSRRCDAARHGAAGRRPGCRRAPDRAVRCPPGRACGAAGTLVLGYAETATALGHCVAESLDADYLHSTRRQVPGYRPVAGFDEEHSHATRHLLLPRRSRAAGRYRAAGAGRRRAVHRPDGAQHHRGAAPELAPAALPDRRPGRPALGRRTATGCARPPSSSAYRSRWWRWRPGGCGCPTTRWSPAGCWPTGSRDDVPGTGPAGTASPVLRGWPSGVAEGGRHGFAAAAHADLARAAAPAGAGAGRPAAGASGGWFPRWQ